MQPSVGIERSPDEEAFKTRFCYYPDAGKEMLQPLITGALQARVGTIQKMREERDKTMIQEEYHNRQEVINNLEADLQRLCRLVVKFDLSIPDDVKAIIDY